MPEPRALTLHGMTFSLADIVAFRAISQPRLVTFLRLRDGTDVQLWDDDAAVVGAWLTRLTLRGRRGYDA